MGPGAARCAQPLQSLFLRLLSVYVKCFLGRVLHLDAAKITINFYEMTNLMTILSSDTFSLSKNFGI